MVEVTYTMDGKEVTAIHIPSAGSLPIGMIVNAMIKCDNCCRTYAIKTVISEARNLDEERANNPYGTGFKTIKSRVIDLLPVATSGKIVCPYCGKAYTEK